MDNAIVVFTDELIEILPPEPNPVSEIAKTCLCCCRPCSSSTMDEDGCGIYDECLSP